ncbi:alpha/beta hydrolase [Miniphocaeibacter massiliensis]|uniref:alpha/beta hydrolase n=1 Tax=Miniphocaeibacter massiliensis TaxID=2041841 RepID=UPI000C1C64D9|nr:alpha/beta hydrolase [Miniphocaeibacter massiliensis]
MDKYFVTKDGVNLRYKENYIENPKAVIVIVHGFAEHIGRYDYITKILNEKKYSVFRYDARGHGLSSSKLGHMKSYKDMIDDLFEIVEYVKERNNETKIFTLGHSMGGNITANFGIKFPNILNGQLFSGAALGYINAASGLKKPLMRMLSRPFKRFYIPNLVDDYISSDERVVKEYKNDPLVLKKATIGFLNQFTVKATENIFKNINKYSYPCFLGHGGDDKIVSKEASKRFYNDISSEDKSLKIYTGLYHEIFNEKKKDTVIKNYIQWLDERC